MASKDKPAKSDSLQLSSNELAAMLASMGIMPGNKEFKIMAKLCSQRTASAYEHAFRAIKAKAKEFREMIESGQIEGMQEMTGKTKGGGAATPLKGAKKGNNAKAKRKKEDSVVDEEDNDGEEEVTSPLKKVKLEQGDNDDDVDLNEMFQ